MYSSCNLASPCISTCKEWKEWKTDWNDTIARASPVGQPVFCKGTAAHSAVSYLTTDTVIFVISAALCSTLFTLLCWWQLRWIIFVSRHYRWEESWIVHEACEFFFFPSLSFHFFLSFLRACLICTVYFSCVCKVSLIFCGLDAG